VSIDINTAFSPELVHQQYVLDRRVRVANFLKADDASQLLQTLARETPFSSAFNIDGDNGVLSDTEMRQLSNDQIQSLQQKIHENASRGSGFLYGRHDITGRSAVDTPAALTQFAELINAEPFLEQIRQISGHADILAASAQATRYLPGNFLTRHNDFHPSEGRRVAYVMNFSPQWHPDWGGMLQFFQDDGTPRDAWAPQFNSLVLFDVAHVHSVTFVAPFAKTPRFAVTGWFRTKPLENQTGY